MSRILIVIVNWNGGARIMNCLDSLFSKINLDRFLIVVVDNDSRDGSPDRVKEKYPQVIMIRNPRNLGFSRANNIALKYVRDHGIETDYFFFLNNDTRWVDDSMGEVLDFMDSRPDIAGLTPCIRGSDRQYQTGVGGWRFTLTHMVLYYFFLSRLPFMKSRGIYVHQDHFVKKKKTVDLDWISGAAMLVRSSSVKNSHFFPEVFFMYAEDLAVSEKLKEMGRLVFYPFFVIEHHREFRLENIRRYFRSLFVYLRQKNFSPFKMRLSRTVIRSGLALRHCLYMFMALFDARNRRRLRIIRLQVRALRQEKVDTGVDSHEYFD